MVASSRHQRARRIVGRSSSAAGIKWSEHCDVTAGHEVHMSKTWRWFMVVPALLVASGLARGGLVALVETDAL